MDLICGTLQSFRWRYCRIFDYDYKIPPLHKTLPKCFYFFSGRVFRAIRVSIQNKRKIMSGNCETCEPNAFARFFKSQEKQLRNFLYYKFGNEEKANDMAQEAFIKLWQNCENVPLEKARSYLYTVAFKKSLKAIAHEKVVLKYAASKVIPIGTNENPEFLMEEQEFKARLLGAIENLNETQRVAFLMHRIDKLKYAEIAEKLGISVKAVEKRIHQAMQSLKQQVEYLR